LVEAPLHVVHVHDRSAPLYGIRWYELDSQVPVKLKVSA
jgi:hypothetical protein